MKKIGIIGGGIVGSTAAYYFAKNGYDVTLFDEGQGQATKAAAGIICPWFSQRRNKPWYQLVANGAEFYRQLMADLAQDGIDTQNIFVENGALLLRKNEKALQRDLQAAITKQIDAPSIQSVKTIPATEIKQLIPILNSQLSATYVQGGAHVFGDLLIDALHHLIKSYGGTIINEQATLMNDYRIQSQTQVATSFDYILLSAGAWLPSLLTPLGFNVDIRAQKGQLFSIKNPDWQNNQWPVVFPPGTADIIPHQDGEVVIGATHEDHQGYDLTVDFSELEQLKQEAQQWLPELANYTIKNVRVGTRAYTSDYAVLVGQVPTTTHVWAISGLGSSGLTSGPYLGYQWYQLIAKGKCQIDANDYPIERYISKNS